MKPQSGARSENVAADVRRRILLHNTRTSPPPHVGGYGGAAFLAGFVCLALGLTLAQPAFSEPPTTEADIPNLVAAAATYQSGDSFEPFRRLEELVRQSEPGARKKLETGLIQLLTPPSTFEARRFACKQLAIIGSIRALPALGKLSRDDETAGIACLALTTYPPGDADRVLRTALPAAHGQSRIQIINTLGDRRDAKAVRLLVKAAREPDQAVAEAAIGSLGKIGSRSAWKAIASLRERSDPALRTALANATLRCAANMAASGDLKRAEAIYQDLLSDSSPPYLRRGVFLALLRLDPDRGEQRALAMLRGSDAELKPVAIAAVASLPANDASQKFAAEMDHLQPQEQIWLIDSVASRGDAPARAAIQNCLAASDAGVRRAAIDGLARVGDASSVALFSQALATSKDAEDARAIESALVGLGGGAETDHAVLAELKKSEGRARAVLIAVLARREGAEANPVLLEEAGESDPTVAKAAFRALGKTAKGDDLPALLEKLANQRDPDALSEARNAATHALARIEDSSRRSSVVRDSLEHASSKEARISLITLLPACGEAASLTTLETAAADSDPAIRDTAVRALADWPNASAWDALAGVAAQTDNESLRGVALRGLVRLAGEQNAHPDAKLVEHYRQLLSDAHGDGDLKLVLGTIGGAASPEALQLTLPLLANAGVRAEAEVAVKKIAESIKADHPQAAQEALQQIQAKQ